jgi:hypothetical protein
VKKLFIFIFLKLDSEIGNLLALTMFSCIIHFRKFFPILASYVVEGNDLSGTIPTELGKLVRLKFLSLKDNALGGTSNASLIWY